MNFSKAWTIHKSPKKCTRKNATNFGALKGRSHSTHTFKAIITLRSEMCPPPPMRSNKLVLSSTGQTTKYSNDSSFATSVDLNDFSFLFLSPFHFIFHFLFNLQNHTA